MSDLHQSVYQIQGQTVNELKALIHLLSENKDNVYIKRIQELEAELRRLKKSKRYGLVWEDKPEGVVERCKNELPVLVEDNSKQIIEGGDDLTHILIEGDNYHALSVLAYTHENKVDVIYIDPPYNTGNKDFMYNDHFVDKEDSFRHSKWLSFMAKRLNLAKNLLKDNGVIFISIDDNEQAQLKVLCDEIFQGGYVSTIVWQKKYAASNDSKGISSIHEYILCYSRNLTGWSPRLLPRPDELNQKYTNPDNDPRGDWSPTNLSVKTFSQANFYEIIGPTGLVFLPPPSRCWVVSKEKYLSLLEDGRIWFGSQGTSRPYLKTFLNEVQQGIVPTSLWLHTEAGHNIGAKSEIRKIFAGNNDLFDTPKPTKLIDRILQISSKKDAIILDFFAGSGTTGHAVLELNKEDGGKRQFILCTNNENKIAEKVTYPRIHNVIKGYADVEGIPANLRYYRTDFIEVDKSIDDLRGKFMGRCTEMLQVRENTFLHFPISKNGSKGGWEGESEYFRVFQNNEKLLVVMYHPYEIETFKKWFEFLREKEQVLENAHLAIHKEIVVYIFSMGGEIFEEELAHLSDRIHIETIPDEVLETYKKIFGF